MRIRPCIDIHNGAVKQIVGSSIRDQSSEVTDNFVSALGADYYAGLYRGQNLAGGHIILLNSREKEPEAYAADLDQARRALAAFPHGMQIGGGVNPENAADFLEMGASHVIVTSYVFREGRLDEDRLEQMLRAVGREHLVLDLSCRRVQADVEAEDAAGNAEVGAAEYRVVTDRWQKLTQLRVTPALLSELSSSCDEFLIHAADVEGKRGGVETELLKILGESCSRTGSDGTGEEPLQVPVTYAGGVHALDDLKLIRQLTGGRVDVTVGSALDLFGGTLKLEDLVHIAQLRKELSCEAGL